MKNRFVLPAVTVTAVVGNLIFVPAASAAEGAPEGASPSEGSRFSIGVLPDTQFYSRYSTPETGNLAQARYGSEPYLAQTQWLVDHQDELNMDFVTHLGDVVDQWNVEGEWQVADKAMQVLDDSDLNYSILPGNHDMDLEGAAAHPYDKWFSADRAKAANSETFQERYTAVNNDSEAHIFEAEGQKYLNLALGWRADEKAIAWAQGIIDKHPGLPVIVTTHEALNIDGEGNVFYSDDYGKGLWDKFIKSNDQIFLVMGGHHHGAGYRVDKNDAGHDVVSILQDYQMAYQGGNGLLGVLEFDLTGKQLEMTALSPWVAQKPHEELTQFDKLTLDDKGDSYSIPFDFEQRFSSFAPEFTVGEGHQPDLAQRARDIAAEGYRPYTIAEDELPKGADDFATNDHTVFHWRPGEARDKDGHALVDGAPAGRGTTIPDIASDSGSNLHRAGAMLGDRVTYSTDHHPLSSDAGSLFWSDPAGKVGNAEFRTDKGAAANSVDTTKGYTFESFVKIPEDFNGAQHGWGSALSRDSAINKLVDGSEDTDPTVMFGISNLRELRWWAEPKQGSGTTVWSHEVPKDEWMHIAVVNDPERDSVEMFINGAPILRNAVGAEGLLPRDLQWVMGGGFDNQRPQDPWYGWIGETRLTQGVLGKDQWLTARAHNDGKPADTAQPATDGSALSSSTSSKPGILGAILGIAGVAGLIGLALPQLKASIPQINALLRKYHLPTLPELG